MPGKARKSEETKKFGECITLIRYNVIHMYKINIYAITYILECFDNDRVYLSSGVARILGRAGLKSAEQGQSITPKKRSSLFLSSQHAQ